MVTHRKPLLDSACHVLREDPELARRISPQRRALAEDTCIARTLDVRRGGWNRPSADVPEGAGLLVLKGMLLRRVIVAGRSGAELIGIGDIVRPWQDGCGAKLRQATAWRALELTRLAVLDDLATERLGRYPEVTRELLARSVERTRRLAVNMAIVHQPRVDIRLQLLFWHLADRWGRVRDGQTILPLRLTHSVLADLIAAQRPTVSAALSDLASRNVIRAAADGLLLLAPLPEAGSAPATPTGTASPRGSTRPGRRADPVRDPGYPPARSPRVRRARRDVSTRPG